MNFVSVPGSEDERSGIGSRGEGRNNASTSLGGSNGTVAGGNDGTGSAGMNRTSFGNGNTEGKPGASLATLAGGGRVSPATLAYGRTSSLPAGGAGAIGPMGRRYER